MPATSAWRSSQRRGSSRRRAAGDVRIERVTGAAARARDHYSARAATERSVFRPRRSAYGTAARDRVARCWSPRWGFGVTTPMREDRPPTLSYKRDTCAGRLTRLFEHLDAGRASPMDDAVMIVEAGDAGRHRIVDRLNRALCPLKCASSSADEIKLRGRSIMLAR